MVTPHLTLPIANFNVLENKQRSSEADYLFYYIPIIIEMLTLEQRIEKLLSKTEALVLLTNKANGYWNLVKFAFNIPLVLTSSAMCIINSISEDANEVKIPNIVVNAVSVLIISLNNSIKANEKCDLFKRLGQQLLLLTGKIENDDIIDENEFKLLSMTYENLVNDIPFEEIPNRYKIVVAESFKDRYLPLQINGCSGNNKYHNNSSRAEIVISNNNIV
jgi:hypothetical protein